MLGALALVVCLGAAGGVGWIFYGLYAPKVGRRRPADRPAPHLIVEPMFAAKKAPSPPRARMARGTGAVRQKPPRADSTEKIVRYAEP